MKILDWNIFKYAAYVVIAVLALSGLNSLLSPGTEADQEPTTDSAFSETSELETAGYAAMADLESVDRGEPIKHTQVTNPVQTLSPQAYDNAAMTYYDEMERKTAYIIDTLNTVEASFYDGMHSTSLEYLAGIVHDENDYFFIMTHGGVPEERHETHKMLMNSGHRVEHAMEEFYHAYYTSDYQRFLDAVVPLIEAESLREDALDNMYRGGVY